jgi:hypothetical protein
VAHLGFSAHDTAHERTLAEERSPRALAPRKKILNKKVGESSPSGPGALRLRLICHDRLSFGDTLPLPFGL